MSVDDRENKLMSEIVAPSSYAFENDDEFKLDADGSKKKLEILLSERGCISLHPFFCGKI